MSGDLAVFGVVGDGGERKFDRERSGLQSGHREQGDTGHRVGLEVPAPAVHVGGAVGVVDRCRDDPVAQRLVQIRYDMDRNFVHLADPDRGGEWLADDDDRTTRIGERPEGGLGPAITVEDAEAAGGSGVSQIEGAEAAGGPLLDLPQCLNGGAQHIGLGLAGGLGPGRSVTGPLGRGEVMERPTASSDGCRDRIPVECRPTPFLEFGELWVDAGIDRKSVV